MTALAITIAIASLAALVIVAGKFARYKATHRFTSHDIDRACERTRKLSAASRAGLSIEHLVPLSPAFTYNPRDARHMGDPIDIIVFDGLDEGALREIVIIEVKSGKRPQLDARERQVRDAVTAGRVRYEVFHQRVSAPPLDADPSSAPAVELPAGEPPPARANASGLEIIELPPRGRRRSARTPRN